MLFRSTALRLAVPSSRCVVYVEREAYAVATLVARFGDRTLDEAPIYSDVSTFDGRPWRGLVDCIIGGFPCTDISNAGLRAGIAGGTKSSLWSHFARTIDQVRPGYVFLENVPAIAFPDRGIDIVQGDLARLGYDAEWCCVEAAEVGAAHFRKRWFCLAIERTPTFQLAYPNTLLAERERIGGILGVAQAADDRDQRELQRDAAGDSGEEVGGRDVADADEGRRRQLTDRPIPTGAGRADALDGGGDLERDGTTGETDHVADPAGVRRAGVSAVLGSTTSEWWREELARSGGALEVFAPSMEKVGLWRAIIGEYPHLAPTVADPYSARRKDRMAGREGGDEQAGSDALGRGGGPDREPTFESGIRRMVNGDAPELDRRARSYRRARIRSVGNCVSPPAAAFAYLILWSRVYGDQR